MKFIPFYDKIEIRPKDRESVIASMDNNFEEMGEVIAVGEGVKYAKIGDTVFFLSYGCSKTPEIDGVRHYIVPCSSEFILGKYEKQE